MQLQYRKVLVFGATSGLGWALASKFVETGTSVIVVGRRKERLDDFAKQHGSASNATVDTAVLDITNLQAIPGFASDMIKKHPDLDCVFLNSGLQRKINWAEPESVDLETIETEMLTNYTAFMHLTKAFLPLLQKQAPKETSIVYTTSGLALVPIMYCPNYCASKAALHHMILVMREQLRDAKSNVKIIELFPPAVQTELHDHEFGDKGKQIGMPLKEFTEEAFEGLCKSGKDNEQVPVQAVKQSMGFDGWEQERQKKMFQMKEMMEKQSH
ncbi:uncharacterized protein LTR77_006774 [Saxophila tyrrhenica]|uniref:NAD(P)-binding protein n=1 Tax=Saxophila tyrrhenica TaxID=1690608 RepID=A0AAV9P8P1_9PEZI|nr:hypothetical protein LTR77_006774 [Saxophila tyrrhenica]